MTELIAPSFGGLYRVKHEGKYIGGIWSGKWAVIATYPKTNLRSVILSRDSKEDCERALEHHPWYKANLQDIEIIQAP